MSSPDLSHLYPLASLHSLFGWEEYAVLTFILLFSALIGVFFAWRGQSSTREFLLASKQMGLFPTTMSIACSFISAITLLGTPAEMYVYGTQYWVIGLAYPFVLAATAHCYLPVLYKLQDSSAHMYLQRRFNRQVSLFATGSYILLTSLYLAIVVYAPSLALAQVTGLQVDMSILVTFTLCIFYTSLGGIKAVIWTNVFQALCMLLSCLVVVIVGEGVVGGPGQVFRDSYMHGRIEIFNLDPSLLTRHTFWSQTVGGYFTWMTIYAVNQTMVQRYLTVKDLRTAKLSIWLSGIAITVILSIVAYAGLIIFSRYLLCDPISSGLVATKDQLLPLFVMDILGQVPGFPGFFVAGVFSGALSTVSGGLNSLTAVALEDIIKPAYRQELSDAAATKISKLLGLGFGVFSYLLTFLVQNIPGLVQAWLGIFGVFGGPVLGLFSLGMYIPWASARAALVSGITSLVFILWVALGGNISRVNQIYSAPQLPFQMSGCPANNTYMTELLVEPPALDWWDHLSIYEISYMWYSGISCCIVVLLGSVLSLVPGLRQDVPVPGDLLVPVFEVVFCCWPDSVNKFIAQIGGWKKEDSDKQECSNEISLKSLKAIQEKGIMP